MNQLSERLHSILFLNDHSQALASLKTGFVQYSKDYCKSLLIYLKKVLKAKKNPATVKLQTLKLVKCLMSSQNPHIVSNCGKKFYNRFKVFALYKKEFKDIRRGTLLFQSETRSQQLASEEFLILLLLCIRDWAETYPLEFNKKFSQYHKLYNYLLSKGVTFPVKGFNVDIKIESFGEKETLERSLSDMRKSVKNLLCLISENKNPELIRRLGQSLGKSLELIKGEIVKYMEMEDHMLIKELNQTLDLLTFGKRAYKSWKVTLERLSILDSPQFTLPPSCLYLKDIEPKSPPAPDELNESMEKSCLPDETVEPCLSTRLDQAEESIVEQPLPNLQTENCKTKDQIEFYEKSLKRYESELGEFSVLYENERRYRLMVESELEKLNRGIRNQAEENEERIVQVLNDFVELKKFNLGLSETVGELEAKIDQLELEIQGKNQLIENIEQSKLAVIQNCKYLEEELEEKVVNESLLLKKIKILEMKFGVQEKVGPIEVVNNIEESPKMPIRVSLLPDFEPFNIDPTICEESFEFAINKNFDRPNNESLIKARISTALPHIDNLSFLKELIKKRRGTLYRNSLIKISSSLKINNFQGSLNLVIENLSENEILKFRTKLFSDPENGLNLRICSEKNEKIESKEKIIKEILFECDDVFTDFPWLKVSFWCNENKNEVFLLIPVGYPLFFEKRSIDFVGEWEGIEEYTETVLKTDKVDIKKIARSINLFRNFEYSYIEGGGVILGTTTPKGILLSVIILKDSNLNIQVKCSNTALRGLFNNMILMQIS